MRLSATPGMGHRMTSICVEGAVSVQCMGLESEPPSRRKVAGKPVRTPPS
ncbi:MAG: hypothetical protein ACLRZQ_00840 [Akkermansia muciniphila]